MAEGPRGTLINHLLGRNTGLCDRRKTDNQIDHRKDSHRDIENHIHIVNLLAGEALTDDGTNEHRGQRTGEGVQRTADHVQLVSAVTATT